ncbi:DNA recombination/repair protein RecA, partial [Eubacteriales bacterium OttesenSCG-928-G02]|nr:DNA recombination/repair protein RecA [Eubacteriales bacterium OttesenSCG-928-G02]
DGDMGASHVGLHARLMSQALRKLSGAIAKSNCIVIFINQLREKVGVVYGNPEVTTGGRALKFYASVRIDVRKGEQLKDGTELIGNHVKCKIVKNKIAPPFKTAEFDIIYGEGISKESELVELGVLYEIIEKSGSWFSYNGERLGQGKDNIRILFKNNKKLAAEIEEKIRIEYAKSKPSFEAPVSDDDEDFNEDDLD